MPDNVSPAGLFDAETVRSFLRTERIGREGKLLFLKETDSTNDEAARQAAAGAGDGLFIVADKQNAGKGRRGRAWKDEGGVNTAMSILLRPDMKPDTAPMLTLIMALSVQGAVKKITGLKTFIKWPNDIVCNGKKLVGILTEMAEENESIKHVVIGTGININQEIFPEEIRDTATSLYLESGKKYSRAEITAECANGFEYYYGIFRRDLSLKSLKDEYNAECVNCGRRVKVLDPSGEYEGEAEGIEDNGNLLVRINDNSVREVRSGEVSVRGVYGYV